MELHLSIIIYLVALSHIIFIFTPYFLGLDEIQILYGLPIKLNQSTVHL